MQEFNDGKPADEEQDEGEAQQVEILINEGQGAGADPPEQASDEEESQASSDGRDEDERQQGLGEDAAGDGENFEGDGGKGCGEEDPDAPLIVPARHHVEFVLAEAGDVGEDELVDGLPSAPADDVADDRAEHAGDGGDGGEVQRFFAVAQAQRAEQDVGGNGEEAGLGEAEGEKGGGGVLVVGEREDPVVQSAVDGPAADGADGGFGGGKLLGGKLHGISAAVIDLRASLVIGVGHAE